MREAIVEQVPDRPEWVETRSALLAGGRLFGEPGGAVVLPPECDTLCVIGRPDAWTLAQAIENGRPGAEVLAQDADHEHVAALLGLAGDPAIIHAPGPAGLRIQPRTLALCTEVLRSTDADRLSQLPPELRDELVAALGWTEITSCAWEGALAAFCYPGSWTENWWDVSVDTVEPYRRRGCAAAAFWAVWEAMRLQGKQPVWGALESNEPSWRLARKLGFEPVARLFVWGL